MGATATVKGGLFESAGLDTLTQVDSFGAAKRRVAQKFSGQGQAVLRELMDTLNGVAPGSLASATRTRVAASEEQGGKRAIETVTLINRNTTADDVTMIDEDVLSTLTSRTTFGANPPANKDGNPLGTR